MRSFSFALTLILTSLGGTMHLETTEAASAPKSIYDIEVKRINDSDAKRINTPDAKAPDAKGIQTPDAKDPKPTKLSAYRGKVLLIVNTASECGYTKQYKGLQDIYAKYNSSGFEVLGFPSNDYGAQEPGSSAEITNFCERKFKVSFPLFEKAPVSGKDIQPLFALLTENAPKKGAVAWNFEKFLISKEGKVIGRYVSKVEPDSAELTSAIEAALKAK